MRFGILLPSFSTTGYRPEPLVIADVARLAEDLGFDGVWTVEHITKPATYNTGWLEPLTVLTWAGAVTSRIDLGAGVVVFPLRSPAVLAWQVAGIQHLTGGRLKLGFGSGYSEEEYRVVGVPMRERGRRFDEGLEVFCRLLQAPAAGHQGRFWQFDGVTLEPRPDRLPEIFIAGGSRSLGGEAEIPASIKGRIVRYGGWASAPLPVERLRRDWLEIADYARSAGRDPATLGHLHVSYVHIVDTADRAKALAEQREAFKFLYSPLRDWESYVQPNCLVGSVDDLQARLDALRRLGVTYVTLGFPTNDPAALAEQLRRYRERLVVPLGTT